MIIKFQQYYKGHQCNYVNSLCLNDFQKYKMTSNDVYICYSKNKLVMQIYQIHDIHIIKKTMRTRYKQNSY